MQLRDRFDITLEAIRAVAWEGQSVDIAPAARALMDSRHTDFAATVAAALDANPTALVYGVTSAPGDGAARLLSAEEWAARPTRLWTAASFGEPLPDRVVRGILLARLANFLGGHAAVRSELAVAVTRMLDEELPRIPGQGNGGAGEILALGHMFYGLAERLRPSAKERMALINGSPCAAALVADVVLAGRTRLTLVEEVFALAVEAVGAPLEAYSEELEALWGDEHESSALSSLRALLEGHAADRQGHQAAVSFRILPRVLSQLRRALAEAERAATVALRSVTDNPVYVGPDPSHLHGAVLSNGGYHNPRATAAIDGLAFACADLCQLAQRQTDHMLQHPVTRALLAPNEWTFKPLHMVQAGWAEEARALAQPSLLALGAYGQNDVPAMSFAAWRKADAIGRCLDASLAILAVLAAHALNLGGRAAPPALLALDRQVRDLVPPVREVRRLGPDCAALTAGFERRVFSGAVASRSVGGSAG
ncbi:MAG: aromatic amino acid lyase [Candidatus Dormibacteraeota bacterium]|nr:aromatic amino acid lyase [Candidatus Dormibacteraeota bacterium]